MIVRTALSRLRDRYHPLFRLRRFRTFNLLALAADRRVFRRLPGIPWPVRLRLVRHLVHWLLPHTVEQGMGAGFRAVIEVASPGRFWDVGANFGWYGWLFLSRDPGGQVVLLEPDPDNLRLLQDTARRTAFAGLEILPLAAADREGRAEFAADWLTGATGSLDPNDLFLPVYLHQRPRRIEVETTTLDALLRRFPAPDLVKIDVEGAEDRVLAGAGELLLRHRPVLFIECGSRSRDAVAARLGRLNYRLINADRPDRPFSEAFNVLAWPDRLSDRLDLLLAAWRKELPPKPSS